MKLTFYFFLWFLTTAISLSQFKTGSVYLQGSLSASQQYYEGKSVGFHLEITPSAGMFVTDNIAVKAVVNYSAYYLEHDWQSSGSTGLGAQYYLTFGNNALYIGENLTTADFRILHSSVTELGGLIKLNDAVFLDVGVDYVKGLNANRLSWISFGIGIISFL